VKYLVYLVKDWKNMEKYGTEPQQIIQVLAEEQKTVIRVVAGEVGFQKEFDNPKDPLISRIIKFCEKDFIKLEKREEVDSFFE
jgi:hypothetical protein